MSRLFFAAAALIGLTLGAASAVSAAPVVHVDARAAHASVTTVGWVYDHHHHRHWVGHHH